MMPIQPPDRARLIVLLATLVFGGMMAYVPFYGYHVLAGRDEQWFFLVILGCWVMTGVLAVGLVVLALTWLRGSWVHMASAMVLAVLFVLTAWISWGGVVDAFNELIAG